MFLFQSINYKNFWYKREFKLALWVSDMICVALYNTEVIFRVILNRLNMKPPSTILWYIANREWQIIIMQ